MNPEALAQALQNLSPIREPAAVTWWPLAIGWWVLIVLSALAICVLLIKWIRYRRANRYRSIAQVGLQLSYEQWQENANSFEYLQSANSLLKRSIRQIYQENEVASRTGPDWAALLNSHAKTALPDSAITALTEECYQPKPTTDIEILHTQLLDWFKSHKSKPVAGAHNA